MGASQFRARALFPELVPLITDPEAAAADPGMAVLSVAYHGDDEKVAGAFLSGIESLGKEKTRQYHEYAFALSSQGVRDLLRRMMSTTHWPLYSDLAKEHYGKGEVTDRRDALLTLVDKRGLILSDKQRELIADAEDLGQLKGWFDAAITAGTADDIFK